MNKKLILTLFAAVSLFSTATLQQNRAFATCSFELTEENIKQSIENHKKEILEVLETMNNFMEQVDAYIMVKNQLCAGLLHMFNEKVNMSNLNKDKICCVLDLLQLKGLGKFRLHSNYLENLIKHFQNLINKFEIYKNSKNLQKHFENSKSYLEALRKEIDSAFYNDGESCVNDHSDYENGCKDINVIINTYGLFGINIDWTNRKIFKCGVNCSNIENNLKQIKENMNKIFAELKPKTKF